MSKVLPHEFEFRYYPDPPEVRKSITGRTIGGYAAKFDKRSQNLGSFIEVIDPKAFNKSAGDQWPGVVCRYQHDDNMLLGTTASGTLQLALDGIGLDYTVALPECREDVLEMVRRKDIQHSSFAMQVLDQIFERGDGDVPLRRLLQCRLVDVSPVTHPAYLDTSTGLRSLAIQFDVDPDEVYELARAHDLRKLFDLTGGPKVPAREALKAVGREARTKNGRQALLETMAAAPVDPRVRLSETMAARSVPGSERLAETERAGTVEGQIAALKAELAEQRAEVARLSDPNLIELEDARLEIAKATELAEIDLKQMSGQPLSGRDALRLMGVAPSPPQPPPAEAETETEVTEPTVPELVEPPQYRGRNPWDALRQLEAMRLPEPPRPAFRACDAYAAESGGRF
jgi:uncharacterized protein